MEPTGWTGKLPTPKDPGPADSLIEVEVQGELLSTTLEQLHSSSLMVNVDYLDLVERVGDAEAWIVLGKLKDLLG